MCLNPPAGKMKWIVCSDHDWLLMWARWALPSRSGFPALVPQKSYFNGHIINPLLTKTTRYSPHSFFAFLLFLTSSRSINMLKRIWPMYPAVFTSRLVCTKITDHTDLECLLSDSEKKRNCYNSEHPEKVLRMKEYSLQAMPFAGNKHFTLFTIFIGLVPRY